MMTKNNILFHDWLSEYLKIYLITKRHYSEKTLKAYKQAFNQIRIYFDTTLNIKFVNMNFDNFNKDNIYSFLTYLKNEKGCSINRINLRLSAFKSFLKYCAEEDIELYNYYVKVKSIHRFKGGKNNKLEYLTTDQVKLLLNEPDTKLRIGKRNQFLMIMLYETGIRLDELLNLKLNDIYRFDNRIEIRVLGKGNKVRRIPILEGVVVHLDNYLKQFHDNSKADEYLFYTKHQNLKTKMCPGTVDAILKKYARQIHEKTPDFPLNLHAHMLRHSIAMAMYKNGVPMSYIKDFLGHSNIMTTSIYAYADDEDIRKALETVKDNFPSNPNRKEKKWKGKEADLLKYCGLE